MGMPDSTATGMSAGQSATHRRTSIIDCATNRINVPINSREEFPKATNATAISRLNRFGIAIVLLVLCDGTPVVALGFFGGIALFIRPRT
jgi:hypothetical protein